MDYKEKGYISVVCYLQDDSDILEHFMAKIVPYILEKFEYYQFVFVDDFSLDDTYETTIKTIKELQLPASIISLSQKHGKERGLLAGLDKAVGDFIIEFDCPVIDFPINLITQSFDAIKAGNEIVIIHPEKPLNLSTRIYYYLFNKLSYLNEPITTERMVVMTRRALNSILSIDERVRYKKALLSLAGFPRKSIPYQPLNNSYVDKRSLSEKFFSAFENLVSYTSIGSLAPISLSILFFVFSVLMGVWVVYNYIFLENVAGVGWVSIMGFMSISFSGLFFLLGILSEYVTKILKEIINIPMYTIGKTFTSSFLNKDELGNKDY